MFTAILVAFGFVALLLGLIVKDVYRRTKRSSLSWFALITLNDALAFALLYLMLILCTLILILHAPHA